MKDNLIIFIILFFFYLYECKKESYTILDNNTPFIKINVLSQIAIVTILPKKLDNYNQNIINNYKIYSSQTNHALYTFNKKSDTGQTWDKFSAILEILKNKHHKYVIWINSNMVFNKSNIRITKYIQKYKDADIILCKDPKIPANIFSTDIMILKNTDWTTKIIQTVINNRNHYTGKIIIENFGSDIGEHAILENIIHRNAILTKKHDIKHLHKNLIILPHNEFNSIPSKKSLKNSFILNLSIIPNKTKQKLIYYINNQLI